MSDTNKDEAFTFPPINKTLREVIQSTYPEEFASLKRLAETQEELLRNLHQHTSGRTNYPYITMSFEVIEDYPGVSHHLMNWVNGITTIKDTTMKKILVPVISDEEIPIIDLTDCDKEG